MSFLQKLKNSLKNSTKQENKGKIPDELQQIISQLRKADPSLINTPDEVLANMILQALQSEQVNQSTMSEDFIRLSASDLAIKAEMLMKVGKWDEAEKYLIASLEKLKKKVDPGAQCRTFILLGRLNRDKGDFGKALSFYRQGLTLAESIKNQHLVSVVHGDIGAMYRMRGDLPKAIEHHEKSLQISTTLNDKKSIANGYVDMGFDYWLTRDLAKSIEASKKAIDLSIKNGWEDVLYKAYGNLGNAYNSQGSTEQAIEMFEKTLKLSLKMGDQISCAHCYTNIANIRIDRGELQEGSDLIQKAIAIRKQAGDQPGLMLDYGIAATVYPKLGKVGEAIDYLKQGINIAKAIGNKSIEKKLNMQLYDLQSRSRSGNPLDMLFGSSGDFEITDDGYPICPKCGEKQPVTAEHLAKSKDSPDVVGMFLCTSCGMMIRH